MRFFTALLISCFALTILDAPPLRPNMHPKTCCGRQICSCTHQKGAFCPFKQQAKQSLPPHYDDVHRMPSSTGAVSRKMCHLQAMSTDAAVSKTIRTNATAATLREAPCHTKASRLALPGYSKDFYLDGSALDGIQVCRQSLFPLSALKIADAFARGIDHPPKILL